jgi:glyoxylase-like metal-dependent hydrolase (beta-lactamase superfamily II)
MRMDYFIWLIRNAERAFVVDLGFSAESAASRQREYLRSPAQALALMGVDAAKVSDLVVTHMHWDHAGTLDDFPAARLHLQDTEMAYCTGRSMCHERLRGGYDVESVTAMVRRVHAGRVVFHDGDAQLACGVSLHRIGGHTAGMQCVRVHTERGWVVLASDCSHYYENMQSGRCFPSVLNLAEMLEGYRRLRELAQSDDHIVPGHDPAVMQRYAAAQPALQGIAARLDCPPISTSVG